MQIDYIPCTVNIQRYIEKGVLNGMDVQFIRCHSNTKKCIPITEGLVATNEEWECKIGQMYIAPREIPKGTGRIIIMKLKKVSDNKYAVDKPILGIHSDMVRKCFTKVDEFVEEGG